MGLFQTLSQSEIADRIDAARQRVIYAAAGLSPVVAAALKAAHRRFSQGKLIVVLDVSADVARMGYGEFRAVRALFDAGVEIRLEPGLRQGLLIVDSLGWAFTTPAQMVEADLRDMEKAPNAIQLTEAQVLVLRGEFDSDFRDDATADLPIETIDAPGCTDDIRAVGSTTLTKESVESITQQLEIVPPREFDLERQVQVYTSMIRFVELESEGLHFTTRKIKLPNTLTVVPTGDRALRERIASYLKLFENDDFPELANVRAELLGLRRDFCRSVPPWGSIVLKRSEPKLVQRVERICARLPEVKAAAMTYVEDVISKARARLEPELAHIVFGDPPDSFHGLYTHTRENAEEFVRSELGRVFPSADDVVGGMSVSLLFKDVTFSTLQDMKFKDKVLTLFPRSALPEGLHTEYDAAKAREQNAH